MRSPRLEAWLLAACLAGAGSCVDSRADTRADTGTAKPALTRERVDAAARALREVPTMTGWRPAHELRLKDDERPAPPPPRGEPAWLGWLRHFVDWLNDAGRWLVWLLGAFAVALVLLRLRRWLRGGAAAGAPEALSLPTHVRELDIRPETLPPDIGAAAAALWQRGEARAAMSLLYRGALSRLVHAHGVPIRASSTEGDCLRLAAARLQAPAQAYLAGLVAAWRETVYAGRTPAAEQGRLLCQAFAERLGGATGAGA